MKVENAAVTAVKVAEDNNGMILRLASIQEEQALVALEIPGMTAAWCCDLAEQNWEALTVADNHTQFLLDHDCVVTLRILY